MSQIEIDQVGTQAGYSLMEAMVSAALLAAFIAISAPSFATLLKKNELSVLSNTVVGSLYFARGHAIAQQHTVHLCQFDLHSSTTCSSNYGFNRQWSNGWLIYSDLNRNNEFDDGDELLRKVSLETSTKVIFNQRGRLRFFPDGSARSAGYYLCSKDLDDVRHILLLHTGRTRVNNKLSKKQQQICEASFAN